MYLQTTQFGLKSRVCVCVYKYQIKEKLIILYGTTFEFCIPLLQVNIDCDGERDMLIICSDLDKKLY